MNKIKRTYGFVPAAAVLIAGCGGGSGGEAPAETIG